MNLVKRPGGRPSWRRRVPGPKVRLWLLASMACLTMLAQIVAGFIPGWLRWTATVAAAVLALLTVLVQALEQGRPSGQPVTPPQPRDVGDGSGSRRTGSAGPKQDGTGNTQISGNRGTVIITNVRDPGSRTGTILSACILVIAASVPLDRLFDLRGGPASEPAQVAAALASRTQAPTISTTATTTSTQAPPAHAPSSDNQAIQREVAKFIREPGDDPPKLDNNLTVVLQLEQLALRDPGLSRAVVTSLSRFVRQRSPNHDLPLGYPRSLKERTPDVWEALRVLSEPGFVPDDVVVELPRTDLRKLELPPGRDLSGANLEGVKMHQHSELQEADLRGADLDGADIDHLLLQGARLQGAVLRGATLNNVHFEGACLHGADLTDATNLTPGEDKQGAHMAGAYADDRTTWPAGFDPVAAGVRFEACPGD